MKTNQEILEKAMAKALQNGWSGSLKGIVFGKGDNAKAAGFNLIFSHDFAKALWGENL